MVKALLKTVTTLNAALKVKAITMAQRSIKIKAGSGVETAIPTFQVQQAGEKLTRRKRGASTPKPKRQSSRSEKAKKSTNTKKRPRAGGKKYVPTGGKTALREKLALDLTKYKLARGSSKDGILKGVNAEMAKLAKASGRAGFARRREPTATPEGPYNLPSSFSSGNVRSLSALAKNLAYEGLPSGLTLRDVLTLQGREDPPNPSPAETIALNQTRGRVEAPQMEQEPTPLEEAVVEDAVTETPPQIQQTRSTSSRTGGDPNAAAQDVKDALSIVQEVRGRLQQTAREAQELIQRQEQNERLRTERTERRSRRRAMTPSTLGQELAEYRQENPPTFSGLASAEAEEEEESPRPPPREPSPSMKRAIEIRERILRGQAERRRLLRESQATGSPLARTVQTPQAMEMTPRSPPTLEPFEEEEEETYPVAPLPTGGYATAYEESTPQQPIRSKTPDSGLGASFPSAIRQERKKPKTPKRLKEGEPGYEEQRNEETRQYQRFMRETRGGQTGEGFGASSSDHHRRVLDAMELARQGKHDDAMVLINAERRLRNDPTLVAEDYIRQLKGSSAPTPMEISLIDETKGSASMPSSRYDPIDAAKEAYYEKMRNDNIFPASGFS